MDLDLKKGLSIKQTAVVLISAFLLILSIIVGVDRGEVTMQMGGLLMDGVLALGTIGYVLLTFLMVSEMRRDIEVRKRHQYRPIVIEKLETEFLPLRADIGKIQHVLRDGEPWWDGPDLTQMGDVVYESYHEVNPGYGLRTIPRFTTHLEADNGAIFAVYQAAGEYSETYDAAVHEMQHLILEHSDDFEGDSEMVRFLAVLALKVDDDGFGMTVWDEWKDAVVPLRDEMPDLMAELKDDKTELKSACNEAKRELDFLYSRTLDEYDISESEVDPDSGPEWGESYASELR